MRSIILVILSFQFSSNAQAALDRKHERDFKPCLFNQYFADSKRMFPSCERPIPEDFPIIELKRKSNLLIAGANGCQICRGPACLEVC